MTAAYDATIFPDMRLAERGELTAWTDERLERAKKLWADGASATRIAEQLGGTTRNAVVGKLHRLGLQRGPAQKMHTRVALVKKRRRHRAIVGKPSSGVQLKPTAIPVPIAPSLEFKVGFFDLTQTTCRFPLWAEDDPPLHEKFFCGAAAPEGEPYCPFHHNHTHSGFPQR